MKILIDGQTLGTPELQRGIGKVFLDLLHHMIDGDVAHEWFIAVKDQTHFSQLTSALQQRLTPVLIPPLRASGAQIEWCRYYGTLLQELSSAIGADIYWNPNPLMPNVHYPLGFNECPTVATLHDLIPRIMPDRFKSLMGDALWSDYVERCTEMSRSNTWVVGVSENSVNDFQKFHPGHEARARVIYHASNYSLFWPYVQGDSLSDPHYVLYVGGFDPRKNMDSALRAFSVFARSVGAERIRFKVVCALDETDRVKYLALASELGVADRIDLTGYISDDELSYLYRGASIFFFPSLYEGFGLPALDALACGVPVVASNTSSIPEVCGEHAFYCDPYDVVAMAASLEAAWRQRDPNDPRRERAVAHARGFRWERAAKYYLEVFSDAATAGRKVPRKHSSHKPRIAYLSPWPPQKSGVADYSYHLMPGLLTRMDITLFAESPEQCVPMSGLRIRSIDDYLVSAHEFDNVIYHLGNGLSHLKIYECALRVPGVIVLHDYNIHPFFHHGYLDTDKEFLYSDALKEYGSEAEAAWLDYKVTGRRPDVWQFPMCHPIVRRSRLTIAHSRWVADQIRGAGNVLVVHHGAHPRAVISDQEQMELRNGLALDNDCYWIGIFGFVNQHKRVHSVLAAAGRLRAKGYPLKILVIGEVNDDRVNLHDLAEKHGVSGILSQEGYVSEDKFLAYMRAVDLVVNLRYPTMGESSGSMFCALSLGKPILVTDYGSFAEIPDNVAWKVPPKEGEVDCITAYIEALMRRPDLGLALGRNAVAFIEDKASLEKVANAYLAAIKVPLSNAKPRVVNE
jgi:glycosyltransferase involved in cell wall biosynthesis